MSNEYTPETDPATNIRSDMWYSMNISQLTNQQDLMITKAALVHSMMGANASQSIINMHGAMQVALTDLTNLINNRSDTTKKA